MKRTPEDKFSRSKRFRPMLPARLAAAMLCILGLASCHIEAEPEVCDYNVHVNYRYVRDISDTQNVVNTYITSIDQYIFDQNGVLFQKGSLPAGSCEGNNVAELTLPEGNYTLVSWGNMGGPSRVNEGTVGLSTINGMNIFLDPDHFAESRVDDNGKTYMVGNTEKLYYGYRTFSVGAKGVSRVNVDMFHSHCRLSITVRWKSNSPTNLKNFNIVYKDITGRYSFLPMHRLYKERWLTHKSEEDDFPLIDNDLIHYSPRRSIESELTAFRKDVNMNVDKKIKTEFITYRYGNDSPLLISLYAGDEQIMKEIDLQRFFAEMSIDLDQNFRQEFDIYFEIDGDKVTVGFVSVNDWDEGGYIGG